jgi:hypothetical protein
MSGASGSWGAPTESTSLTGQAKQKVKDWWATVLKIQSTPIPPKDAEIVAWRKKILDRAYTLRSMIRTLVGANLSAEMGLGIAPVVIVGGVAMAGILGYISLQMVDAKKYFARADLVKKTADALVKKGVDADTALRRAGDAADSAGLTSEPKIFGIKVKYIAYGLIGLGIAGFFFSRKNNASVIMVPKS